MNFGFSPLGTMNACSMLYGCSSICHCDIYLNTSNAGCYGSERKKTGILESSKMSSCESTWAKFHGRSVIQDTILKAENMQNARNPKGGGFLF